MKRLLAVAGLVAAAVAVPAPSASANHLCVTSGGQTVYCAPHIQREVVCVTSGGRPIVCV